jgi:elongation factor Ts
MANISASMVKELREKSGVGMMDCKTALSENDGDLDAAMDWLRTKGLAKAAKKADRIAAEGLVGVAVDGTKGVVVEVNSETDFVARNETFQTMVSDITTLSLSAGSDFDSVNNAVFPGSDKNVGEYITAMVATIGENMNLRRVSGVTVSEGAVAAYVHNQIASGLGKIGVLVGLESTGDKAKLVEFGKQVAMHIAAIGPLALSPEELDPAVIEKEKAVLSEQARESGKPENIIEKMIEGRIRKFYQEVVLLSQTFVIDGESTVAQAVKAAEASVGAPVKITGFIRFSLGEGLEKKEEDFAAEVAAVTSGS